MTALRLVKDETESKRRTCIKKRGEKTSKILSDEELRSIHVRYRRDRILMICQKRSRINAKPRTGERGIDGEKVAIICNVRKQFIEVVLF